MQDKEIKGGVYEVIGDNLLPVTQAIKETPDKVIMRFLDEVQQHRIKPIAEACAVCDFWQDKFASIKECQARQNKDAKQRGFTQVICPKQFKE